MVVDVGGHGVVVVVVATAEWAACAAVAGSACPAQNSREQSILSIAFSLLPQGGVRRKLASAFNRLRGCDGPGRHAAAQRPHGTKISVATVAAHRPADDRAAERRVLLAAFAQAERHRDHADDHRERRHHDRAEGASRRPRVLPSERIVMFLICADLREGDDQGSSSRSPRPCT